VETSPVKKYLARFGKMKSDRSNYDSFWQEVSDYMLPRRDFTSQRTQGEKRTQKIYDSTALHAIEQLAGGLHGMLTPPNGKWLFLRARERDDYAERKWLDTAAEYLFDLFASPESKFATAAFEFYLDIVAYGNAAMSVTHSPETGITFTTEQLQSCYTVENATGRNDIIYLCRKYRPVEIIRKFGEAAVHKNVRDAYEKGQAITFEILQVIEPRDEHYGRGAAKDKKPYKSCFIDVANEHLMLEEGFDDFPFMFARWSKRAGEDYGYGPGMAALSEVKQLNTMVEIMTRAAAKNADPILLYPDLGEPKFLQTGAQPNYFDSLIEQKRALLMKIFYVDWMNLPLVDRMTTVEVNQRIQDSLRQLSPMLSRLTSEFLSPLIQRTLFLALDNGLLERPPAALQGRQVKIEYTSPMAIAQRAVSAQAVTQGLAIGAQLAQFDPAATMIVNAESIYRDQLLNTYAWPVDYIRDEEEVNEMKAQQQQAAAAAQQAQVAESYGKTAKNVAGALSEVGGV
jgi:hypothetical protein